MKYIAVIGGDGRQAILAELLAEDGFAVCTVGLGSPWEVPLETAVRAEAVILPLPLGDGVGGVTTETLFGMLRSGTPVLAGQVKPAQRQAAEARGIRLVDYFLREELTVANAAATAEAALRVAMEHTDRTLLGTEVLVLGFGRIGKLLAFRLHGLGGRVTATARKPEDLAWIEAFGWRAEKTDDALRDLGRFPVIFNTIPSTIINKEMLRGAGSPLVVDLASVSGVEAKAAEVLGERYIWARGLPGKLVPRTAAMAIRRAVHAVLREWEG